MDDRIVKLPVMLSKNSGRTYAQRWVARLTPDEALTAVHRMMSAYSNSGPCTPEYLMSLTEALCQFPMETATAACSPVHGVPKEQKNYRPHIGQVVEWCERQAAWLYRMTEREGLLRVDSHKTYTGIISLLNQRDNPYGTLLHDDTKSVARNKESVSRQQKYTTEERCAHVERLRAQGRLTFDTGPEAERRKSFFDRLTKGEAEKILADNTRVALAPELAPVPF
jgi:hypothetical protein